mgnify:CR=1 FL=1
MNLMLGYKENHGLVFPEISTSPMLFLHIRDLALPRMLPLASFSPGNMKD